MKARERRRPAGNLPKNQSVKYYGNSKNDSQASTSPFKILSKGRGLAGRLVDFIIFLAAISVLVLLVAVKIPAQLSVDSEIYNTQAAYARTANELMGSLSYKNKVTFDEQELANRLKDRYPEISEVKVSLPVFSLSPRLELWIYPPTILLKNGSANFIVDSQGRAVGQSADFTNLPALIEAVDESGFEISVGKQVLSRSAVDFIKSLSGHLSKAKIPVESLILPDKPQELHLRTEDQGYFVKFHLGGSPDAQIGQFLAAREHFKKENITPQQYLDARVQGRVFYK